MSDQGQRAFANRGDSDRPPQAALKKFAVKLADILRKDRSLISTVVEADYFRIQDGVLTFRISARGNQYPEAVHVFAPGTWLEVEPIHE
jgi:hypothetical protein